MIRALSPLLLGTLLVPGLVQDHGKLRPISGQVASDKTSDDVDDLIAQLSSTEFSDRKQAAAKLEKLGKKALPKLEALAKSSEDPDLRFQARRLIRRIEGRSQGLDRVEPKSDSRPSNPSGHPGGQRRPDDIQDQIERQLDEVRKRLEEMGIRGGLRPLDFDDLFRSGFPKLPKDSVGKSSSQSTKVRVGPDGVEVEIDDNGKTKRYTAPDMETLLKNHPELKGRVGGSTEIRIGDPDAFGGPMRDRFESLRREMDRMRKEFERDFGRELHRGFGKRDSGSEAKRDRDEQREPKQLRRIEPDQKDDGPKLGVMIRPASPDVVSFLGLPAGVGLMVEEVVDGSTAAKIGLEAGDLVVKVNGKWIRSASDVATALREGKDGTTVEYYRKGQKRTGGSK